MTLPTLVTPTYQIKLPVSGIELGYRPFLVKEEKILMIASEAKDEQQILSALKTVIKNCVDVRLNLDDIPLVDVEYLFLQLRSKSVGETVELVKPFECSECGHKDNIKIKVDLSKVKVKKSRVSTDIKLTDKVGIKMKYPTFSVSTVQGKDETERIFDILCKCVDSIYDENGVYAAKDYTTKELRDFLESLTQGQFQDLTEFFNSLPSLSHEVIIPCPKCGKEEKLILNNLYDFF